MSNRTIVIDAERYEGSFIMRYFAWLKVFIVVMSLTLSISGMIHVADTFRFFSDEQHLFEDSLWAADEEDIKSQVNVSSLYSGYYKYHYPERGAHPNGIVLLLGGYIWVLKIFKELAPSNVIFFVMAIRFLLIGAVLISLYLLYLLHKEMDETSGKWTGVLSVSFAALFPPLVAYGGIRAMDTMSLLFLMICLWSLARLIKSGKPSLSMWLIPGLAAGIFLILKKSGVLVIPVMIIHGFLISQKWEWKEIGKKLLIPIIISIVVLVITNDPFLYFKELLSPSLEGQNIEHNVFASSGIKKFGFLGYQLAKLWELFHPDYYHYLGYHRHASPDIQFLGLINKHLTSPFLILWSVSIILLLILKKWKEAILLNAPLIILVLSLPNFAPYRLLPVIPLFLSTPSTAYIALLNRYPYYKHRLVVTLIFMFMFLTFSFSSVGSSQEIDGETYLDMAEISSRNRNIRFGRGIFYDRTLVKWKAERLDSPFALIPLEDGIVKTALSFKKAGEYSIDFLVASQMKYSEYPHEIRVKLNNRILIMKTAPNTLRWYSSEPLQISPDELRQELTIMFKGISSGPTRGSSRITLYDIRVLGSGQKQMEERIGHIPTPWWTTAQINKH